MNPPEVVGLIINPRAGRGYAANARAAQAALAALHPERVVTGPGELGASALANTGFTGVTVVDVPELPGREATQALATVLTEQPLAAIVVIGGDGTLADVACVLIARRSRIPLLGIGVGSTNAGSLITCRAAEIERLAPERLQVVPQRALLAYAGDRLLGVGFNDCVLGFTVVGTLDGVVCDLDAAAKLAGRDQPGAPGRIGSTRTRVARTGPDGIQSLAGGSKVATLVVGFAEPAYFAKAVTGGVCLAALVGAPAGALVADVPLVQIGLSRADVLALPPIHSSYITLDENQRIRVSGVRRGTALCVDGNPLLLMNPEDTIEFGVALHAVQALHWV